MKEDNHINCYMIITKEFYRSGNDLGQAANPTEITGSELQFRDLLVLDRFHK